LKLRIARHTDQLEKIKTFYIETLNFESLGSFFDHNGYNGAFLSYPNQTWHLEFTSSGNAVQHQPDADDLIVLYPGKRFYDSIITELKAKGIEHVPAKNPYWNRHGFHFKDPDGFGIVIALEPENKVQ
jgi:hypothetical protein